ncbi:MAG: GNAT family N-acetyltransferase [Chitinophagaceae bacterium]|nr:MAG: GNAT family N-acetyltransferase [Chitinophagaceae bacterium]
METIEIRTAGAEDLALLQQLGRKTFLETFSESNTAENMQHYLAESFSAERLTRELQTPGSSFYLAFAGKRPAGYLKVNTGRAQTELHDGQALEIERIYVLHQFQGQKVGQALFEKALRLAGEMGASCVWLGVWEQNEKAIGFYKKNGFVVFDKHLFQLGGEAQTDILMKRKV